MAVVCLLNRSVLYCAAAPIYYSVSPAGKANPLREPQNHRSLLADLAFLLALSACLACLHHALRGHRPLFAAPRNPGYSTLTSISAAKVRESLGKPSMVLVDARPETVFREGTIPGSLSLPLHHNLEGEVIDRLENAEQVVVFCSSAQCSASKEQALALRSRGIDAVLVYEGGMEEWRRLGYPVSSSSP